MKTIFNPMLLQKQAIRERQSFGMIIGTVAGIAACAAALAISSPVFAQSQKGGGGGGGGHTETAGNNLSVPAIWADTAGPGLVVPAVPGELPGVLQAKVTVPWASMVGGYYAYAQKTLGNVWQAENEVSPGLVFVNEIDWGDMLESSPLKVGTPIRIELAMYATSIGGMPLAKRGFEMVMLGNPSSPDEIQGVMSSLNASPTAPAYAQHLLGTTGEATVFSPLGALVVQKLIGLRDDIQTGDLSWSLSTSQWIDGSAADPSGIEAPNSSLTFGGEINVGGKVIYGLSKGGWRATQAGDYRITFYLPLTSEARFNASTVIRASLEAVATEEGAGATAYVDYVNNLTYIDVRVAGGGGSKGGKNK